MGFLEELMGEIGSAAASSGAAVAPAAAAAPADAHAAVTQAVLGMMAEPGGGGLAALTQGFTEGGLGHLVQSWISNGPNQPATPHQIQQGLGADIVGQIAQRAGVSPQVASAILAVVLPIIINKLTPQGEAPSQDSLGGLLGGLLGGGGAPGGAGGALGGILGGLLK